MNQTISSRLEKPCLALELFLAKIKHSSNLIIYLHKQGKYYIVHFKELFALDGKDTNLSENDIARRNTINNLLTDWGLVDVVGTSKIEATPLSQIKVISFKEKGDWKLETKYNIGKKKKVSKNETRRIYYARQETGRGGSCGTHRKH